MLFQQNNFLRRRRGTTDNFCTPPTKPVGNAWYFKWTEIFLLQKCTAEVLSLGNYTSGSQSVSPNFRCLFRHRSIQYVKVEFSSSPIIIITLSVIKNYLNDESKWLLYLC